MAEYTMPEERDFIDSWACAHVRHELNSEQTKKEAREFLARIKHDAWEECAAMAAHYGDFDGGRARWLSSINPHSATEKEDA